MALFLHRARWFEYSLSANYPAYHPVQDKLMNDGSVTVEGGPAGLFASWQSSIRVRYLVVSLLAALLPLGVVVALYDHYTENLVVGALGERMETGLAATSSKLGDFLKNRSYQLESLADYPGLTALARPAAGQPDPRLMAVVRYEIDNPDLYGVMLLDGEDRVITVLSAQGSGEQTRSSGEPIVVRHLPRVSMNDVELIGPSPPHGGVPGWFLLRRRIQGEELSVALQIRLASLTELLGAHAAPGLYRPVLLAPGGYVLTSVGTPLPAGRELELARGPEIAPGWRPAMLRDPDRLPATSASFRYLLMALAAASGGAIIWLYLHLSARMRRQITPLIEGARAVAQGDLNWRIEAHGGDEIAVLSRSLNQMSAKLRSMIAAQIEVEKRAVLGEFATSVAHEVRNPLATMKASVQGLMMSEHDPARRSMLAVIVDEIERMNDVVETLLHYARPTPPERSPVSARDLLRRVAALVGPLSEEAGVSVSLSGDRELEVLADPRQLQQILMNLALNSIQAMPEGGALGLRAQRDGEWGVITLTDTGSGIRPELLDRVTEAFFTTKPAGTGLGLAISRQLAEMNGGSLSIASTPGSGTSVAVRLPLARTSREDRLA